MSTLDAAGLWVSEPRRTLLAPTSVRIESGSIAVVYGDPGHRHTLLALALGGRLVPDGGVITVDQDDTPGALQRRVALVDVPGVSEPDEVSRLTTIVGEELAMAGRPAGRRHVEEWLSGHGLWKYHKKRIEDLPAGARSVALAQLAAQRPGVEFLVLTFPERHGIDADSWLSTARALAENGYGVLATTSAGVARQVELHAPDVTLSSFGNAEFHRPEEAEAAPEPGEETASGSAAESVSVGVHAAVTGEDES